LAGWQPGLKTRVFWAKPSQIKGRSATLLPFFVFTGFVFTGTF